METKDLIGLILLLMATGGCALAACLSHRLRDGMFFLMTAAIVMTEKLDINFFGQFWYRGTTRGIEFSFVDVLAIAVLIGSLLFPRRGEARFYWPASLGLMLFYLMYVCGVVLVTEPRLYGIYELSKMVRGFVFFLAAALFIRSPRELGILVVALACAVCFEGLLAAKQRLLDQLYRVTGNLDHANSLSMYLCMVTPILAAAIHSTLPRWIRNFCGVAIAAATLTIVFTVSRAGIPIFILVVVATTALCMSWKVTLQKVAVAAVILVAGGGLLIKSWDILKDRYGESSLSQEYLDERAVESRGYFLRLARVIVADRIFGVGLNNWSYWVSKKYGAQLNTPYENYDDLDYTPDKTIVSTYNYAAPAHNLGALTVGEIGLPGLGLFLLLWLRWLHMGFRFLWQRTPLAMQRLGTGIFFGLVGVFLQSLTEWVFRQTQIYLTFHLLIGVLAGLCHARQCAKRQAIPAQATAPTLEYAAALGKGPACA